MRIGQGIDAHIFQAGRRLVLGGVTIEHDQGLAAHSDGDVVLHALCDALLGAAAQGDIGHHFPPGDEQWKDADSRELLRRVVSIIQDKSFAIGNVDLTVVAEAPRLSPYIDAMRENISRDLGIEKDRINVKATTTEKMGFTGRGEGIAAFAVVLLDDA